MHFPTLQSFLKINPFFIIPLIINCSLAFTFLRTLAPGKEALISVVAKISRGGDLPQELIAYTRVLTRIWGIYFLAVSVVSFVLFFFPFDRERTVYFNLLFYSLPVALFLGEYVFRKIRFPYHHHSSPLEVIKSIQRSGILKRRGKDV